MGRYSFFIIFFVDIYAPSRFLNSESIYINVYAAGNSTNSDDVQSSEVSSDGSFQQKENQFEYDDSKNTENQITETENISAESGIEVEPFAFPSNNWGFNYQIDPTQSKGSDWAYWVRYTLLPNYNNFIDHVVDRTMVQQAQIHDNQQNITANYDWLDRRITNVNSNLNTQISALTGTVASNYSWLDTRITNQIALVKDTAKSNYDWLDKRIDGTKADVATNRANILAVSSDVTSGFSNYFSANWQYLDQGIVDSDGTFTKALKGQTNRIRDVIISSRDNIDRINSNVDSKFGANWQYLEQGIVESDGTFTKVIKGQTNRIRDAIIETRTNINNVRTAVDGLGSKVDSVGTKVNTLNTSTVNNGSKLDLINKNFNDITATDSNAYVASDSLLARLIKGMNRLTQGSIEKSSSNIVTAVTTASNKIKDYTVLLTTLNLSTVANKTSIDSFSKKNDENLTFLLGAIKSLKNYDDSTLKTTINNVGSKIKDYTTQLNAIKSAVDSVKTNMKDYTSVLNSISVSNTLNGTKIDSFAKKNDEGLTFLLAGIAGLKNYDDENMRKTVSTAFSDYLKASPASVEGGAVSTDGVFTRLIKGQFTRLIAELNRIFTLQIGKFDQIRTAVTQLDQNIAEQFSLLYDWLKLEMEWLEVLSQNLLTVAKNITTSNNWLKSIYEKPSGGNIINPAPEGTNFWDVLKSLVDGLADIAKSIVGLVDDLLDKLVHLIIPENPDFFADDISKLTDSFDLKFSWAIDLSDSFKGIYSQPKSLKSLNISVAGKQYKVVPDFVDLNLIKTILTGYFCFLTLFTSYKRIVGGGDVIQ